MTYKEFLEEFYSIRRSNLSEHYQWLAIDLLQEDYEKEKRA